MSEKKYIQSIERASKIVQYIADKKRAKLNEICESTGLKTTTAFGILQTLEHVGQVTRNGLDYTLGLNSLKLGLAYLDSHGLSDKIHELLLGLVGAIDETAYFALEVGDRYYYLDYVLSSHPLKVVPEEGNYIHLPEKSAIAQVFNNTAEEFRYATDLEDVFKGTNCFAVPYWTAGKLVGCVAASGPSSRFTADKMKEAYVKYQEVMNELGLEKHLVS